MFHKYKREKLNFYLFKNALLTSIHLVQMFFKNYFLGILEIRFEKQFVYTKNAVYYKVYIRSYLWEKGADTIVKFPLINKLFEKASVLFSKQKQRF